MQRKVLVTWTCSEEIQLDIPDGVKTSDEIHEAVNQTAQNVLPDYTTEWDWEWVSKEPVEKGAPELPPPEDCWIEVRGYTVATDGYVVVTKDCPIEVRSALPWKKLDKPDRLNFIFDVDFLNLPLHGGWFTVSRKEFQGKGFRVLGKTPNSSGFYGPQYFGYVVNELDRLVAILMPAQYSEEPNKDLYFQFNEVA